jgi:hypothetical protein
MLGPMWKRWLAAGFLAATLALPACGGDSDSPFEGDWIYESGKRLLFSGSDWKDSDGNVGSFDYTGDGPVYIVSFHTANRTIFQRATFADEKTLELCLTFADGSVSDCQNLVFDKPTLH